MPAPEEEQAEYEFAEPEMDEMEFEDPEAEHLSDSSTVEKDGMIYHESRDELGATA